MEKLVILGNGFDLACGMKTSFYDFYKNVKAKIEMPNGYLPNCNFILFLIYETFFANQDTTKAFQKALAIDCYDNWMDIELLLNHFVLGETFKIAEGEYNPTLQNRNDSFIALQFRKYFQKRKSDISNFELFVHSELYEFELMLRNYIAAEASSDLIYMQFKDGLLEKIVGDPKTCKIMTFNYTIPTTLVDYKNVNYVHGSLRGEIIVGIDVLDLQKGDGYKRINGVVSDKTMFTKTRKKLSHTAIDEASNSVFDKDVKKIYFYGHSLSEQDYSYFQSLFDYYDIYSSDISLEFCYSEYDPKNPAVEVDRLTTRVFNLLNKYGETFDNKNHGNNLLHKMLLENRLSFRKIDYKCGNNYLKFFCQY
ncbi:MAG: bacteriophage abortive infection AbiH family protein [Bacilli bacterium]|nr:bacteriophage abortive infection AbiH family protein [Bacilli bacterium]